MSCGKKVPSKVETGLFRQNSPAKRVWMVVSENRMCQEELVCHPWREVREGERDEARSNQMVGREEGKEKTTGSSHGR